jgi:hypothetical protein
VFYFHAFTYSILEFFQRHRHHVVSLDPNKFAEKKQQRLHIGDLLRFRPLIMLQNQSSPVISPHVTYDMTGKHDYMSYPPDTKGFLYYFTSLEKPRIAGELRFRVASSDDSASFQSGSDLMKINGQVWSRPLIVLSKLYPPLYEKLREELLVPDDLDAVLSTFPPRFPKYSQTQFLYTLNDTFIVNFSYHDQKFNIVTEQGMEILRLTGLFSETSAYLLPYTGESPSLESPRLMILNEFVGSALARFERSTLPDHIGTRTVVLRFLKIITPVKCVIPLYHGNIVPPEEGELHRRFPQWKTNQLVKSFNIDKKESRLMKCFQLLWDA